MSPPPSLPSRRLAVVLAAGLAVASFVAFAGWWFFSKANSSLPSQADPLALTPLSSNPFLNSGPEAHDVGSEACIGCHTEEHRSYLRTGMSRSTVAVAPGMELPDGALDHALSGLRFEAFRRDGQLHHRDRFLAAGPADVVLNDFPLAYGIGSGRHARTYVVEADGFLVQAPLTWYASGKRWDLSPGYDHPNHQGFERPIGTPCLFCHVGRFEVTKNSFHSYRIEEAAIGCERCHGPGSLHVAFREGAEAGPAGLKGVDYTIVNPRRLSRDLAEAVCQQCHLAGDVAVQARGRHFTDYRPGLPLQDVLHVFRLANAGPEMTVTGHVEQLHQSRCYQKSDSLTCTTCHNPHGFPEKGQRVPYYRAVCLQCHGEGTCTVAAEKRRRESPENSCVQCHMPTGSTDVPHLAFSHHRIGIHKAVETRPRLLPPLDPFGEQEALESFHDLTRFGALDRKRSLGLAYAKAGSHQEIAQAVEPFNRRSRLLLSDVWKEGLRDGPVASALAVTNYKFDPWDVRPFAESALGDPELEGEDRCDVLFLLADDEFKRGRYAEAADWLRQVTKLRRVAVDWSYLSKCERMLGREAEGIQALETAARISPTKARFRRELADLYDKKGDRERAEWHRKRIPPGTDP